MSKRRERIAPSFKDPQALTDARKDNQAHTGEGTYARTGYRELREREREIAEMIGIPDAALFNAGMAALATVIEAENLHAGDVVLCGQDMYGKTKDLVNSLTERGVRVVPIDSGNIEEIRKAIENEKPRLILVEAVANAPQMQVCDVAELSKLAEEAETRYRSEYNPNVLLEKYLVTREYGAAFSLEQKEDILTSIAEFKEGSNPMVLRDVVRIIEGTTQFSRRDAILEVARLTKYLLKEERTSLTVVLDNTLSSPVLRNPLNEVGEREATVVVVESGTKHYQMGKDQITLGVVYSNSAAKLSRIKEKRTEIGTYLQPSSEALLPEQLTTKISEAVKLQATHALALAKLLEGTPGVTAVHHPNMASHKDSDLVQALAPEGITTLFYVIVEDPVRFVEDIKKVAGDAIEIGTSFGHEKTRLLPIPRKGAVRIAAGMEDETAFIRLTESFKEALAHI